MALNAVMLTIAALYAGVYIGNWGARMQATKRSSIAVPNAFDQVIFEFSLVWIVGILYLSLR